jgi:hypothetical protein
MVELRLRTYRELLPHHKLKKIIMCAKEVTPGMQVVVGEQVHIYGGTSEDWWGEEVGAGSERRRSLRPKSGAGSVLRNSS